MKFRILVICAVVAVLGLAIAGNIHPDQTAVAADGKTVILKDDGTWEYLAAVDRGGTGKWRSSQSADPMSDATRTMFYLKADKGKGSYGDPVDFCIRQTNGKTEAFINWYSYLGSDNINVTSRIDDEEATSEIWSISTDSKASFVPKRFYYRQKQTIKQFLAQLCEAETLVVRLSPYNESPITAMFDVRGLKAAAEPYRQYLDWIEPATQ